MSIVKIQPTCTDRIAESLKALNEEITNQANNTEYDDYFNDLALSVDTFELTSVCLSYGGPSSYLEIKHQGTDIISVTYRFSDWFDTATVPVLECEPAYEYAQFVIDGME